MWHGADIHIHRPEADQRIDIATVQLERTFKGTARHLQQMLGG